MPPTAVSLNSPSLTLRYTSNIRELRLFHRVRGHHPQRDEVHSRRDGSPEPDARPILPLSRPGQFVVDGMGEEIVQAGGFQLTTAKEGGTIQIGQFNHVGIEG